ncbi:MAG: phage terminase large subunit [Clostridia bacterium]|nr:phage terminase large subunit [Clostridia bacterium]
MPTENNNGSAELIRRVPGAPNERQREFFASRARFTAYGGARGGGKSWALRRKLVLMCLRYPSLRCLLVRRSLAELRSNHLRQIMAELDGAVTWNEGDKCVIFPNGSRIFLGYCSSERDTLRYQGQEYDVIAIDEATQLTEYQFSIFKACLRGTSDLPRRMYLTCNPGGIGHAWVKRLFIDREFRRGESPEDHVFVPATVFDNGILTQRDPEYVRRLESLPPRLRDAWLYGRWDVFEGQFFPEFDPERHVCEPFAIPTLCGYAAAFDYGFDMLAAYVIGIDREGGLWVLREFCRSDLTLSEAARHVADLCDGLPVAYAVASPDLWNRRQDSGKSGFEIMQSVPGMPPMRPADDRRIPGWRVLREYLALPGSGSPRLHVSRDCRELLRCLPALLHDRNNPEDAADEPHSVTHSPEALRYAVMSRIPDLSPAVRTPPQKPDFRFPPRNGNGIFD